jgi:hypothetical protein
MSHEMATMEDRRARDVLGTHRTKLGKFGRQELEDRIGWHNVQSIDRPGSSV